MRESVCVSVILSQGCLPRSVTVRCASGPATRVDVVVATSNPVRNLRVGTERISLRLVQMVRRILH